MAKKTVKTPCRAKGRITCDGQTAVILRSSSKPGGGRNILYQCTKCKKTFGLFY